MSSRPEIPFKLDSIKNILVDAAAIVDNLYQANIDVINKADGSPVTQADLQVDAFLKASLSEIMPDAGWLSEETTDDPTRLAKDWAWIVDPLDGTNEFARGNPEFAISIGLVFQEQAILGGVINPASGQGGLGLLDGPVEFWGELNQRSPVVSLSDTCAILSRTEATDGTVLPYTHLVGSSYLVGSVAYKLMRVAAGHDHLTFSVQHKSEWDICGGVALLNSARKAYRRFDGKPLRFNQKDTRIRSGAVAGDENLVNQFLAALSFP